MRSFISRAALLVKVTARIWHGQRLAGGDDVGEAGGQHRGLAGAGAGQHQHRAFGRQHGLALRRVEAGEVGGRLRPDGGAGARRQRPGFGSGGLSRKGGAPIGSGRLVADKALDQKANSVEAGPVRMHRRRAEVPGLVAAARRPYIGSRLADLRRGVSMRALILAASVFVLAPGVAAAQVERLPATSRAERQIIDNNRALDLQQGREASPSRPVRDRRAAQPAPAAAMFSPPGRGCPTGAVSC